MIPRGHSIRGRRIQYEPDNNEDEEQCEARHKREETERNKRSIKLGNGELTPRFVECENCGEEFDIGENERGDCVWHPGKHFLSMLCSC